MPQSPLTTRYVVVFFFISSPPQKKNPIPFKSAYFDIRQNNPHKFAHRRHHTCKNKTHLNIIKICVIYGFENVLFYTPTYRRRRRAVRYNHSFFMHFIVVVQSQYIYK